VVEGAVDTTPGICSPHAISTGGTSHRESLPVTASQVLYLPVYLLQHPLQYIF
jgi:hypothetical protein